MVRIFTNLKKLDGRIDTLAEEMKDKKVAFRPSIVGPIIFIVFSIAILLLMPSQIKVQQDQIINARTFPRMLTYLMLGSSVVVLAQALFNLARHKPIEKLELELLTEVKAVLMLAMLVLYAVLMKPIGFIASSVIYAILMLYYFRVKNWKYYVILVVSAIAIGVIFRYVLNVRLP
jgi:putative tricarboxylic transport membrane protein